MHKANKMELRVVTTEKGKILVDESAEIKEGDWFFFKTDYKDHQGIYKNVYSNTVPNDSYCASGFGYCLKTMCSKITATINHSISLDVPMVIVEDEVEKLAKEIVIKNNPNGVENFSMNVFNGLVNYITKSLKAQQKGVYSEDDLIKFVDFLESKPMRKFEKNEWKRLTNSQEDEPKNFKTLTDKEVIQWYIESLNQDYIELEIEEVYSGETLASAGGFSLKTDAIKTIKTDRVNG